MAKIDLAAALRYPSTDPAWVRKCVTHGLYGLVPLVGPFALVGWQRRIFHAQRAGKAKGLPEPRFWEEVQEGVAPVFAMMNLLVFALPMVFVALGVSLYTQSILDPAREEDLNQLLGTMFVVVVLLQVAGLGVALLGQLTLPELLRRGFHGERSPLFTPGPSLARFRAAPADLAFTILGMIVANTLGSMGFYVLFVGGILTVPWAGACVAHLVAQWEGATDPSPPPGGV